MASARAGGFGVAACQFLGVFGGYVAAGQAAMQLAYVLAVSVPALYPAIGARLEGWFIAGAVSTLAGTFLWLQFEHRVLLEKVAAACRALAARVNDQRASASFALGDAVTAGRTTLDAVSQPFGSGTAPLAADFERPDISEEDELLDATARTVDGAPSLLAHRTRMCNLDLKVIRDLLGDHRSVVRRWIPRGLVHRSAQSLG